MEELSYTSKFDGETTDKILDNAKSIMEQTTAEDGETVSRRAKANIHGMPIMSFGLQPSTLLLRATA